jgi:hypothetical protein
MGHICSCSRGLFNDAVSNSAFVGSNEWLIINNELDRMWKETIVA